MHKLIYSSQAVEETDREDLRQILAVSRERNASAAVTGHLLYSGAAFLQVLEGHEAAVQSTFVRIEADLRHTDIRVLADVATHQRAFGSWSMGFAYFDPVVPTSGTADIGDALRDRATAEELLARAIGTGGGP